MSHPSDQPVICPNCGFAAERNFCAQCGQETHLHKESFWGLVMHFVGHYFHYDSKFWMTMKALWFKPGKLTTAYWEGKRMRYIPPISLYIFISAVYFILNASGFHKAIGVGKKEKNPAAKTMRALSKDLDSLKEENLTETQKDSLFAVAMQANDDSSAFGHFMVNKLKRINNPKEEASKKIKEELWHNFPKVFFFMIPVLALMLKILFARRKETWFVQHAIFSLHTHTLFFSLLTLAIFNPIRVIDNLFEFSLFILGGIYLLVAMKNVYRIGYFRAVLNVLFISVGYFISFAVAMVLLFVILMATF